MAVVFLVVCMSTLLHILIVSPANYVFSLSRNFQMPKSQGGLAESGQVCTTRKNKCWKLYPAILQPSKQPATIIF